MRCRGSRISVGVISVGVSSIMIGVERVHRRIWREGSPSAGSRSIPEETAVALTYNGGTYAVMMTTPRDLEDFAVGFSLSEGVISSSADIDSLEIVPLDEGVEVRMWLAQPRAARFGGGRGGIAGPTGRRVWGHAT